jgi:nucleoside-diphosphate-sugar epimerase
MTQSGEYEVLGSVRRMDGAFRSAAKRVFPAIVAPGTDWRDAVKGVDVVVHAAAHVHVMKGHSAEEARHFRIVNVDGTMNLARQASMHGVKRFIFISTIKVNGEQTAMGKPFRAEDEPNPGDSYSTSKYEAEQGLFELQSGSDMEVVIIRPPLVYGPGVKANFLQMMRWVNRGVPLPLAAIHNRRSLVAIENLVDLILQCTRHPSAANAIFLVADRDPVSISELLRKIGVALGKPARLFSINPRLLNWLLALAGKRDLSDRLCGSLEVDFSRTSEVLGWFPVVSQEQALEATAQHFLAKQS